jgi:type IV pilus assembly protein PilP
MKKKANRHITSVALLVVALLVSFGCKKQSPPPPPPSPQKPAVAKPVQPVQPVQAQVSSLKSARPGGSLLDFSNKKDPFKPFASEPPPTQQTTRPGAAARRGNLLPIQSYDVNKFRISGIITGLKENTALIIDPAGKGYVVREGMLIGINDGRINRITPSAIEVIEQKRDEKGHLRKSTIKLSLPKKK